MNKILLSFVTGVSLCGTSAFAMDPPPFSTDDASLRLQSRRPMVMAIQESVVLSRLDYGIFSEPREYLVSGGLLKEILERVDENNAQHVGTYNQDVFDLENPDYESGSYESGASGDMTEYRLFDRQNLDKERYSMITNTMSFNAKPCAPSKVTNKTYSWIIQGYYPTGENFSLKIVNLNRLSKNDPEGKEVAAKEEERFWALLLGPNSTSKQRRNFERGWEKAQAAMSSKRFNPAQPTESGEGE